MNTCKYDVQEELGIMKNIARPQRANLKIQSRKKGSVVIWEVVEGRLVWEAGYYGGGG